MPYRFIIIILLLPFVGIFAQDDLPSEAYKKNGFSKRTPLIKPKYPSYSLAATYVLTEKAKSGDPFAQHELGIRYILGVGLPVDTVEAAYWIGKAASKNLPAANFNYAIILNSGIGIDWNPFSSFKNFKIAAESGMEQGQYVLGLMYTDNLIVNKNLKEAQKWLEKSAARGFEEAKKVLEEFVKQGLIQSTDSLKVIDLEKNSTSKNVDYSSIVSSEYELDFYNFSGDSLSDSEDKVILNELLASKSKDLRKMLKINELEDLSSLKDTTAMDLIEFASTQGSPEALLIKARLYEHGIKVKQNYINASTNYLKAFRLGSYKAAESLLKISQKKHFYIDLEKQVKADNPNAMYVWAGLVALGLDYSITEKQAFELLVKAKNQNHINSIIELGLAYYSGTIVNKDSLKAIDYFKEASKLGSSEAEVRLAYININNPDTSKQKQNIQIIQRYSETGSVLAEAALAYCYEIGIAVKQNKAKAARLYRQAAQRGNEAAYNSLRNMYDLLRPEEEEFQIYL